MPKEVRIRTPDDLRALTDRLDDLTDLLDASGQLMVAASTRAFEEQRLGDITWPPRYFGRGEPFLNLASAVEKWTRGSTVKARDLRDRPALVSTGALASSIVSDAVGKDAVAVGSALSYAGDMQKGGTTTQPVTETTRRGMRKFVRSARGRPFRDRLQFLENVDSLETDIIPRPFLGFTNELKADLIGTAEEFFAGELN